MTNKLILVLLFAISHSLALFAQKPPQSVIKRSYPLILFKNGIWDSPATGFLIKKKGRIFLVSNYHVIASQNTMTGKPMEVRVDSIKFPHVSSINTLIEYKFSVKAIWKKSKSFMFYQKPDIYALDITKNIPKKSNLYIIDSSFDIPKVPVDTLDVFAVGYKDAIQNNMIPTLVVYKPFNYSKEIIPFDQGRIQVPYKSIKLLGNISGGGMSGSPIFMRYNIKGDREKKEHFAFIGVVSSSMKEYDATLYVPRKDVEAEITSRLRH